MEKIDYIFQLLEETGFVSEAPIKTFQIGTDVVKQMAAKRALQASQKNLLLSSMPKQIRAEKLAAIATKLRGLKI